MTQVNIVVSEHALKPLIHINDLKTVETAVHKLLCMDSLPEPQQKELSNDILYYWQEDMGDNGRHCVQPLVHVLVSERLTALFASMMEEPFMCHVMPAESTPRSMDWILVLHFDAFQRIQDMAFTESRKLLTADASIEKFIHERVVITKDSVRPNECYAVSHDVVRAPLTTAKWKTAHVCYDGATVNVWQANALEKYATKAAISGCEPGGVDEAVREANTVQEKIAALIGGERLLVIYPHQGDDTHIQVMQDTGRSLVSALRLAKHYALIVILTQAGDLRHLLTFKGDAITTLEGVGKRIADEISSAGGKVDGSGIDTVPGNGVPVWSRLVYLIPVGSQLRAEFAELERLVVKLRPMEGFADIPMVNYLGRKESLHYPPYQDFIKKIMGDGISEAARQNGLVLVTLQDDFSKLSGITDQEGKMIATDRGLGNSIATAFGGLIGQPARK